MFLSLIESEFSQPCECAPEIIAFAAFRNQPKLQKISTATFSAIQIHFKCVQFNVIIIYSIQRVGCMLHALASVLL